MSFLKDKIGPVGKATCGREVDAIYARYGILRNPFPSAGQTWDHPRMLTSVDDEIIPYIQAYNREHTSQVLIIEGTQGVGKTNLLNFYDKELTDLYSDAGFYLIRYFADPEPGFDKMLVRLLQELGIDFLKNIGMTLAQQGDIDKSRIIDLARSSDMRIVLHNLARSSQEDADHFDLTANAALEWLLGFRLLKRHREFFRGLQFRLDTVESKTVALRDLVFCSTELEVLKGLILLFDELEKQDYSRSKMQLLRFLSAIRALIDALPKYLLLMTAMTPESRQRYFAMLPAFSGRLQNRIEIEPLKDEKSAVDLYKFYLKHSQNEAEKKRGRDAVSDKRPVIKRDNVVLTFNKLMEEARNRGDEGVRQRDFLNKLHKLAESEIQFGSTENKFS